MKRFMIYMALLAALLLLPEHGTDIGRLRPVGLVQLYKENENLFIVTDTGDSGVGITIDAAFENLEDTTSGVIFLDTADYLLVSRTAIQEVQGLQQYLKPSIYVCIADKKIDPKQAAEYLAVHKPTFRLKNQRNLRDVQKLISENGRLNLK